MIETVFVMVETQVIRMRYKSLCMSTLASVWASVALYTLHLISTILHKIILKKLSIHCAFYLLLITACWLGWRKEWLPNQTR